MLAFGHMLDTRPFIFAVSLISSFALACDGANPADPPSAAVSPAGVPSVETSSVAVSGPTAQSAKNVFLLTIDTLRADYLGFMGGPAKTPNLDALAQGGWNFEECISASMLTNPSHSSIMTSLYPRDHGVYDNESGIGDDVPTLAKSFSAAGFSTAAVIGFPHLNPEVANLGRGFDFIRKATRKELNATQTTDVVFAHIDSHAAEYRFMWIHYTDPHAPYHGHGQQKAVDGTTPMSKVVAAAPGFQRKNPWFKNAFKTHATAEEIRALYIAEIESLDLAIGLLVKGLGERGLGDSVIAITSDHGENMGEHGLYFHHGGLYRSTVHVPLIITSAQTQPKRFKHQVATVDIAPTLLELAGIDGWGKMRGHSLAGVATDSLQAREYTFSEHMMGQLLSVRSETSTLISHRKSTKQFPSYHFVAGQNEAYHEHDGVKEAEQTTSDSPEFKALLSQAKLYLESGLELEPKAAIAQDFHSLRALGYIE